MPSSNSLSEHDRCKLLECAHQSIEYGIVHHRSPRIELDTISGSLTGIRSTFVTLTIDEKLRGCMGTLEATLPLIQDVTDNAYNAAFSDPRFDPLSQQELTGIAIHISILSPATAISFKTEQDLIKSLRPRVDGLILQDGKHRATFLPTVWKSLPDPRRFLNHLKQKAGLPEDYWSDQIRFFRYETETIE